MAGVNYVCVKKTACHARKAVDRRSFETERKTYFVKKTACLAREQADRRSFGTERRKSFVKKTALSCQKAGRPAVF